MGADPVFTTHHGEIARYELRSAREGHARRVRILSQTQLDKLFHCKDPKLSRRQWQAGRNLQGLYHRCCFAALKSQALEKIVHGLPRMADSAIVARKDYTRLMEDVGRLGESALYWIVISDYSPREYGEAKGLYKTDGIGVLRAALDLLADLMELERDSDPGKPCGS